MNEYYTHSGYPATDADGDSADMRAELALIEIIGDKLPVLSGNGGKFVKVNAGGTALEAEVGSVATADLVNDSVTYAKIQNVSATDKLLGRSTAGAGDVEEIACTAAGRAILDDADATAQRATLGLVIGTNVQAYDAGLQSIAGLTTAADRMIYTTASDTYAVATLTSAGRALLDDADAAAQRSTLGLVIGTNVQAYDADTAKLDAAQTWTAAQTLTSNLSLTGASSSLGFGTGAGGTVTQLTSKSTAVTLDKPSGQITMHNASLASGASVVFDVNNSLVTTSHFPIVQPVWANPFYSAACINVTSGGFSIRVTNLTGAPLSQALVVGFAIIKGATA